MYVFSLSCSCKHSRTLAHPNLNINTPQYKTHYYTLHTHTHTHTHTLTHARTHTRAHTHTHARAYLGQSLLFLPALGQGDLSLQLETVLLLPRHGLLGACVRHRHPLNRRHAPSKTEGHGGLGAGPLRSVQGTVGRVEERRDGYVIVRLLAAATATRALVCVCVRARVCTVTGALVCASMEAKCSGRVGGALHV